MRKILLTLWVALSCSTVFAQGKYDSDVATVDAALNTLYEVISGKAGEARDWDRFRHLLHPDARLTPIFPLKTGGNGTRFFTVEEFVKAATVNVAEEGFFEREIGRRTETFGDLVHCFSAYESFHSKDEEKPFDRGINSIQLMFDGTRWWVMNIVWQSESPERPIPKRYLKRK
jgi:hypothetical protein